MNHYQIYFEEADTDEPRRFLGEVQADTSAQALFQASQYYEIPEYDLVAVQVNEKPEYSQE